MCLTSSPKRLKLQGLQGKACIIKSTQYMISRCVDCVGRSKDLGTPAAEGHAAYPSVQNSHDDQHLRATPLDEFLLVSSTYHGDFSHPSTTKRAKPATARAPCKLKFGSLDKLLPHSGLEED